jgi:hypothetical protein
MSPRRSVLVLAVLATVGCAQKDKTPPPAPWVDPVASPTHQSPVIVTGSAEYGSTVTITGGASTVTVTADPFTALWRASVPLNTTIPASAVYVQNSLSITATDAAGNVSVATAVEIKFGPEPGIATSIGLTLTGAAADGVINAGDSLTYSYAPKDAYDNATTDPIVVVTNAPNAEILDDGLSGSGMALNLLRAGSYTLSARAVGGVGVVGVQEVRSFTINVASGPRYVDLIVTLPRMTVHDTTMALTTVHDVYNNVVVADTDGTSAHLTLSCVATTVGTCTRTGNVFAMDRSGVYKITAAFDDGAGNTGSASQYVYVEDVVDVVPPTATITSVLFPTSTTAVPRGGRVEVSIDFHDNMGLADGTLYAIFGGNAACTATPRTLVLNGQTTALAVAASITVPACAYYFDSIDLFVRVTDQAGNIGFSATNRTLSIAAGIFSALSAGTGYSLGVFFLGTSTNGADVAVDPAGGIAYVTRTNQTVSAILPDRTSTSLRDSQTNVYNWTSPWGIAFADGVLFVGDTNGGFGGGNGSITIVPPDLPPAIPTVASNLDGPGRLAFDPRPGAGTNPVVCAGRNDNNGGTANTASAATCWFWDAAAQTLTARWAVSVAGKALESVAVGAESTTTPGTYTLWLMATDCTLWTTTSDFLTTTAPAAPTQVTVTGAWTPSGTCADIAALPSGAIAVADVNAGQVSRVAADGASTLLLDGIANPSGLDFAVDTLYVLDPSDQVLLTLSATTGVF